MDEAIAMEVDKLIARQYGLLKFVRVPTYAYTYIVQLGVGEISPAVLVMHCLP